MEPAHLLRQLRSDAKEWSGRRAITQRAEIELWLERRGWRRIGSGAFACVYRQPGAQHVVKVFPLAGQAGSATWAYLRSALRSVNPIMPRVHGLAQIGRMGVAVLEFLRQATAWRPALAVADDLKRYFNVTRARPRPLERADLSALSMRSEGLHYHFGDLAQVTRRLRAIRQTSGRARLDLHPGNLMARQTVEGRQLVVTDPLA